MIINMIEIHDSDVKEQNNVCHKNWRSVGYQSGCVSRQKIDECSVDCISANNSAQHHGPFFCLLSEILL